MAEAVTPHYRGRVGGICGKNLPRKMGVVFAPRRKRSLVRMVDNLQDGPLQSPPLGLHTTVDLYDNRI